MDKTCRRCGRDDGSPVSYYHDSCFDGPKMEVENHLLRVRNAELVAALKKLTNSTALSCTKHYADMRIDRDHLKEAGTAIAKAEGV